MKIEELIKEGSKILAQNKIETPIQVCRILLSTLLQKTKEYLIIHMEESVDKDIERKYKKNVKKIANGYPLQYITNHQEFMKLNFFVNESVLIPRQDTEILVEEVIELAKGREGVKILDLCTGSGVIGISIAKYLPNAKVTITDISKEALQVAKINAEKNKVEANMIESDLFERISKDSFDIIVSNPPYIETDVIRTLDKQVQKEPILALDGGKDGLEIYRRIVRQAYEYIHQDGYLCLEIGYNQKGTVTNLLKQTDKYTDIISKKDLASRDRIIIAKRR